MDAEVAADAETLEPAILIMWGVWSLTGVTFIPLCGDLLPTLAARRIIRLASSVCWSTAYVNHRYVKGRIGKINKLKNVKWYRHTK